MKVQPKKIIGPEKNEYVVTDIEGEHFICSEKRYNGILIHWHNIFRYKILGDNHEIPNV